MKYTLKQKQQMIAPILVILIIVSLFLAYAIIHIYKDDSADSDNAEPTNVPEEVGLVTCEDLGCPADTQYVASSESNVYHECDSGYAQAILPQNRVCFVNSTEAEDADYKAAAK